MATWKSTPEERAQAADLVLKRVDTGYTLGDSVRHFAHALEVSEDSLRRWVRQEKATREGAAAAPAAVATAVLDVPVATVPVAAGAPAVDPIAAMLSRPRDAEPEPATPNAWHKYRRVISIAAAIVAATAGSALVGHFGDSSSKNASKRVADYIAGKGTHEFVAADSGFRATFPFGAPHRDTKTQQVGPASVNLVTYATESDSGAFSVSSLVLPTGVPYDLNGGVNGAAVAIGGHIDSANATTFEGHQAIEFIISGTLSGHSYVDKGLIVTAGDHAYLLQAIWENSAAPGYDAFKASFHIT